MKSNTYFPHDANARHDEKILALRVRYGMEGYGVYFAILERLRESSDLSHANDYNLIAFELHVDASVVKAVVENFGLFSFTDDNGKRFYSESMLRRMGEIERIRALRSEAGKKGVTVKAQQNIDSEDINTVETGKTQANPKQTLSKVQANPEQTLSKPQANLLKEKERKEREEKELPCGSSEETASLAANTSLAAETEAYKPSGKAVRSTGKSIAEREADFRKDVAAHADQYAADMLEKFVDYWTEHTPGALRMRFEKQAVFDIPRRLKRFYQNDFGSPKTKSHGTSIDQTLAAHISAGIARGRAATEREKS
ncbi:MAG: DUF4373 domain-containing protein [Tannerellaceae bacterium]|jgi:hypothetical protein|nr:DUF4373 domain-containing protein [Tannerellaceae bacterium]